MRSLERWGTRRPQPRHPKEPRPGRRFHRTFANVREDVHRFPRVSAFVRISALLPDSASCRVRWVAGLCAESALRCAAARSPGCCRSADRSRGLATGLEAVRQLPCSAALVASPRCSPGQPRESPSAAPRASSSVCSRGRKVPGSRGPSRLATTAGPGGNPGADLNGTTTRRNPPSSSLIKCAGSSLVLVYLSTCPPGNRLIGAAGVIGAVGGRCAVWQARAGGRSNGKRAPGRSDAVRLPARRKPS